MKKQQLMSLVTLSGLVLSTGLPVLANDVVVGEPSSTVTETQPTPAAENTVVVGGESAPVETTPSLTENQPTLVLGSNEATVPVDTSSSSSVVESNENPQPLAPSEPNQPPTSESSSETVSSSTESVVETQVQSAQKSASDNQSVVQSVVTQEAAVQTIQVLPVTTNPIEAPVMTQSGATIVGTENSQVIVQQVDGTREVKAPEAVGAKKQADGTVVVKDKEGKLTVLPATGEKSGLTMLVSGVLMMAAGLFVALDYKKKKKKEQE